MNRLMMNKTLFRLAIAVLCSLSAAVLFTGCKHKELCRIYDYAEVIVKVDFKKVLATEGFVMPPSMRLYVYKPSGEILANVPIDIYQYEGQKVTLPVGNFHMMVINENSNVLEDVENPSVRAGRSIFNVMGYRMMTPQLSELKVKKRKVKRLEGYDDQPIHMSADPTCVELKKNYNIHRPAASEGLQVIEFVPEDPLTRYTIIAHDAKNAVRYAPRSSDGAITGAVYSLAEGFMPAKWQSTEEMAIYPQVYSVVKSETKEDSYDIVAKFRAFGSPLTMDPRGIKLQIFVATGEERGAVSPAIDVSDQIANQADPRNVVIHLYGIELPEPIAGGGWQVDVEGWGEIIEVPISL